MKNAKKKKKNGKINLVISVKDSQKFLYEKKWENMFFRWKRRSNKAKFNIFIFLRKSTFMQGYSLWQYWM